MAAATQEVRTLLNGPATLAYRVIGPADPAAPALCLIASTGRGPDDFAALAATLAAGGVRVVLPWPRGLGESNGPLDDIDFHDLAADAAAVLEAEAGSGGAFIAGHAYGCWIARTVAQDRPDLVDGLILLAAGAGAWPDALSDAVEVAGDNSASVDERLAALRLAFFAEGNDPRPWLAGWDTRLLQAQRTARARTDRNSWWPSGNAPILDIIGLQDPFRAAANREFYVQEFAPRVTLRPVNGASHALPEERPEEVANIMLSWCENNSKPRATLQKSPPMRVQVMSRETAGIGYGKVGFRIEENIAFVEIDNPPVNAGSQAIRKGLIEGIKRAAAENASAAIILGVGRCFVAGSDLREFDKPLEWPELPDVIGAIEDAPFPVLAAMHGVALGGGLELALGCDYRIAAPGTKLGLPEVSLGFVPGAGGTQRLPRLIGRSAAMDVICRAALIPASEALSLGLVDALAEDDLAAAAVAFLASRTRPKRLVREMQVPEETPEALDAAAATARKRGKGRPNVDEAIRLVLLAKGDAEAALTQERAVFQRLRLSADAFALRYLFFAERQAAAVPGIDRKETRPVAAVGVVGGGTMGQGIVRAFLAADLAVTLLERDTAMLEAALGRIHDHLDAQVVKGRLAVEDAEASKQRLDGAVEYDDLAHCDLVIEAVFEEMAVKQQVLAHLEDVLAPEAIIATNTSYLDIDEMAADLAHPERVLGLHFFSPADIMPLLEVVRAGKSAPAVLGTGLKLARALGKQPVVARVAEGFIGNRIYAAYRRRAELLVLDGATPTQVDEAATSFGFAMGPFAVADMSGLDIAWAMRKRQAASRDPAARYVTIPDRLCEAGRLGRKTGAGWYDYSSGKPAPDPVVQAIIDTARAEAGINMVAFDAETIQRQLMAAIVNEAARVLEEGVAQRPSDVDVVLANGYGFPRWRGGPLYWAAQQDRLVLETDLAAMASALGHGFQAGPVAKVLTQLDTGKGG